MLSIANQSRIHLNTSSQYYFRFVYCFSFENNNFYQKRIEPTLVVIEAQTLVQKLNMLMYLRSIKINFVFFSILPAPSSLRNDLKIAIEPELTCNNKVPWSTICNDFKSTDASLFASFKKSVFCFLSFIWKTKLRLLLVMNVMVKLELYYEEENNSEMRNQ